MNGAAGEGSGPSPALTVAATPSGSAFAITDPLPWGRDAAEYTAFFELHHLAPEARVLDCGGGPSTFTIEMVRQGRPTIAVDPLYRLDARAIECRVADTSEVMREGLLAAHARFVWALYGSPDGLIARRLATLQVFLEDYEAGRRAGRYLAAALPHLPFADGAFDLVLCSHLLFLYDHRLDLCFHEAALLEMLRLGREARIFPLLDLNGRASKLVAPVTGWLRRMGFQVGVEPIGYEFQKGGDHMLRIKRP